jgi:hypothetical protein
MNTHGTGRMEMKLCNESTPSLGGAVVGFRRVREL